MLRQSLSGSPGKDWKAEQESVMRAAGTQGVGSQGSGKHLVCQSLAGGVQSAAMCSF